VMRADISLVGAGNIGSHAASLVARLPLVARLVVVDRDRYESSNVPHQQIFASDIGKSKAEVQARRAWQINPSIEERAIHQPVEALPLATLRSTAILAAVDGRRVRMAINRAAFQLGVPWFDSGVLADGSLARVNVYVPGPDSPCLECAWCDRDYALVEQAYACGASAPELPTGASATLGALAAALMVSELEKLLAGDTDHLLAGRQVIVDAVHHLAIVTSFRRNPTCRMPDHAPWVIERLALDLAETTLGGLAAAIAPAAPDPSGVGVGVAGQQWIVSASCPRCCRTVPAARLLRGGDPPARARCSVCGATVVATGRDTRDEATLGELLASSADVPLASLGLLAGDVLSLEAGGDVRHLELVPPRPEVPRPWPVGPREELLADEVLATRSSQ
jgi:hypothetical protein